MVLECQIYAFRMHILVFSIVQSGKGQFLVEVVYSVSELYLRLSFVHFITSAIFSVNESTLPA